MPRYTKKNKQNKSIETFELDYNPKTNNEHANKASRKSKRVSFTTNDSRALLLALDPLSKVEQERVLKALLAEREPAVLEYYQQSPGAMDCGRLALANALQAPVVFDEHLRALADHMDELKSKDPDPSVRLNHKLTKCAATTPITITSAATATATTAAAATAAAATAAQRRAAPRTLPRSAAQHSASVPAC
jgi:hypothetical protein